MFMNVAMWEHCTFDNEIFRCGKIYYSNAIIIINLCKLSFQIVGLKVSSMPTLVWKPPSKIFNGI
jgi:hypothetical protein